MATIIGKKTFGRLETLEYANKKFGWGDVIIGISAYYGFLAWIRAKLTGKRCIYYCIDFYSPEIADNWVDFVFIWLSHQIDRFLVNHCETWDISARIAQGRAKFGRKQGKVSRTTKIVTLSYPPTYFRFKTPKNPKKVVFVGLRDYGLELLDDYTWLRGLPLEKLLDELSNSGIGVSLWKNNGNNYYGDPGKTKLYSACGLPVIMTDNSPFSEVIKKTQAGIVVDYNEKSVKRAINKILWNYGFYKENVKKTWRFINADIVFRDIEVLGK